MTPPKSSNNEASKSINVGTGSDYWFGQIVERLSSIEKKLEKVENQEEKLNELEKEILSTKKDLENIETDVGEIRDLITDQAQSKPRWFQIASGIASLTAIAISTITLLNIESIIK